jgi:hypothetical protein
MPPAAHWNQLAALQVKMRRAAGGNAGTNTDKVKPPKFDGSTSWVVFQRQRRPLTF